MDRCLEADGVISYVEVAMNSSKLWLFGGVNLKSYCDSTIFEFNTGKNLLFYLLSLDPSTLANYYEDLDI